MIDIFQYLGYDVTEDDITSFKLEDCLDIPKDIISMVVGMSLSKGFMNTKPIEDGAIWCLRNLYRLTGKAIPFITSRKEPENTIYYLENYIVKDQFPYLVKHGSWDDGLKTWDRKLKQIKELGCVAMVEDAPETLRVLSENYVIPILIDRPYNRYCTWALRFTDWRTVLNLALMLEQRRI
jgi:hypothetical protein